MRTLVFLVVYSCCNTLIINNISIEVIVFTRNVIYLLKVTTKTDFRLVNVTTVLIMCSVYLLYKLNPYSVQALNVDFIQTRFNSIYGML